MGPLADSTAFAVPLKVQDFLEKITEALSHVLIESKLRKTVFNITYEARPNPSSSYHNQYYSDYRFQSVIPTDLYLRYMY